MQDWENCRPAGKGPDPTGSGSRSLDLGPDPTGSGSRSGTLILRSYTFQSGEGAMAQTSRPYFPAEPITGCPLYPESTE